MKNSGVAILFTLLAVHQCCGQSPLQTFSANKQLIVVEVMLGATKHPFVIDTGSSHHILDSQILGLATASPKKPTIFDPQPLLLATRNVGGRKEFVSTDLSNFREASGIQISGLLGAPLLTYTLFVDFDKGQIKLSNQPLRIPSTANVMPVILDPFDCPCLSNVNVNGNEVDFLIDSGFTGAISLKSEIFDAMLEDGSIGNCVSTSYATHRSYEDTTEGDLQSVALGNFTLKDVPVMRDSVNRLGLQFIKRFNFSLNTESFAIQKSRYFSVPFERNISGISVLAQDHKLVVHRAVAGGPGSEAGIEEGDIITGINGVKIQYSDLLLLRSKLSSQNAGKTVSLAIDGVTHDVILPSHSSGSEKLVVRPSKNVRAR